MKLTELILNSKGCSIFRYLALCVLCYVCFHDTLRGEFVFDDLVAIVKNRDVTNGSTTLSEIFSHDFWGQHIADNTSHKSYRPLTILMFHYEYQLFNLNSFAMKFVNSIIHCLNTCLLHKFYSAVTSKIVVSFLAAILFAIHPVHTEAVCGIVGRAELMFCLCYIVCLILFSSISFGTKTNLALIPTYVMIVLLSLIGLLFKENAITIMPTCIAYDITIRTNLLQKVEGRFRVKRIVFLRFTIFMALTILLFIGRLSVQQFKSPEFKSMDNPVSSSNDLLTKFLSQNFLYIVNSWILLCPNWLSFDWALGCIRLIDSFLDSRVAGILLFYVILYFLTTKCSRLVRLAVVLMVVPFLPASGIIRVGFVIAERILYVPSIGFCLLVAIGFSTIIDKYSKYKILSKILFFVLLLFIIVHVLRTRQRAKEWMTEEKLFSSALDVCPDNAKVHYNIAKLAGDAGDMKKSFKHYHKAISLYPEYESALMNLGNLYREVGDTETAEKYLRSSIQILEQFPAAWMNLGIVQAMQKKYDDALESYQKALSYKKRYPTCLYNLGNLYLDMQNYSMAMAYWHQSISLDPKQHKAWANILALLDNGGFYEDVLRVSERALSYIPNDTSILFARANVQGKLQNYIEAEELYKKIIAINPTKALYHSNLGVLYHRWGKKDLAIISYKRALELSTDLKSAKENLAKLLKNR